MKNLFLLLFFATFVTLTAQVPVGAWRDHLSYHQCRKVLKVGTKLYVSTPTNIFTYNTSDNSVEKLSKITGLSNVGIATMEYYSQKNILLVAYENGGIDLIKGQDITAISDVKNRIMMGSKKANSVYFRDKYAMLCYSFGIVQLDLDKHEIKDTWYIGEQGTTYEVYGLTSDDTYYYAATSKGVFRALITDPYLINYSTWQREANIPNKAGRYSFITNFAGYPVVNSSGDDTHSDTLFYLSDNVWHPFPLSLYDYRYDIRANGDKLTVACQSGLYIIDSKFRLVYSTSTYGFAYAEPRSALIDESGAYWIADNASGLVTLSANSSEFKYIYPNGPYYATVGQMICHNGNMYVTGGSVDGAWNGRFNPGSLYIFKDEQWDSRVNYKALDYMYLAGDPINKSDVYVGGWGTGLWKYTDDAPPINYNASNSPLTSMITGQDYVRVAGMTFDSQNNLWMACTGVGSPVVVKRVDGTWKSFAWGSVINSSNQGQIQLDLNGQFWMVLPRGGGMFVFNPNNIDNDDDDKYLKFKPENAYGDVLSNIYCVTIDRNGAIWIGTDQGPVYYSTPETVFDGDTNGEQPKIPRNDGKGTVDPLLAGEVINCIAVDGGNRKWFATASGGAFLCSADGTKQLLHFNVDNSPILSNTVKSIAVSDVTGEVFFGTDKGIISYRGTSTMPNEEFTNVYVYPNPVRPNYQGSITIVGLIENCHVRITDISGNLVWACVSTGGSAVWDGKNRNGRKVASGVYVVFLSNDDGSKTYVTKFAVVH